VERRTNVSTKFKEIGLKALIKLDEVQIPVGVALIGLGVFMPPLIPIGIFMAGGSAITLPIERKALANLESGGVNSTPVGERRILGFKLPSFRSPVVVPQMA
jgi:hypothetical protein